MSPKRTGPRILISAGEVSGDVTASLVCRHLRERAPAAVLWGIGGWRMAEAGVDILGHSNRLGAVGLSEVFAVLPRLVGLASRIRARVLERRPDVALLVGNDLFNAVLGRWLRRRGVRTVAYFPPQVWLWRSLARIFSHSFDDILTSFPEEQTVYERAGGRATYVGHYLCDRLPPVTDGARRSARRSLGLNEEGPVVGLLPGSRDQEVFVLGPILFSAARELAQSFPELRFVVPVAEPDYEEALRSEVQRHGLDCRVVLTRDSHQALRASDLLLVTSGTATLEAALLGVPMIVVYRISAVTRASVLLILHLGLIHSETVALPNLVLGREVVPELQQGRLEPAKLAALATELLADLERRDAMRRELLAVRALLEGDDPLSRVADVVLGGANVAPGIAVKPPENCESRGRARRRDDDLVPRTRGRR